MSKNKYLLIFLSILLSAAGKAQVNCSTLDINKVPGKWVWDKRGGGDYAPSNSQWQICSPIKNEVQRIMPVALDGLHATISIAFSNSTAVPNTNNAPKSYDCYLKLKKYECLKGYNILQPEGETDCWVYFLVNRISDLPAGVGFGYYETEQDLIAGDFYTTKDAAGNRILYISSFDSPDRKMGYYFSAQDRLPLRKITWKELVRSYNRYSEKKLNSQLVYLKEGLAKNEKELVTTQYADTKEYLQKLITDRKKELKTLEEEKLVLQNWFTRILQEKKINENAKIGRGTLTAKGIEQLMNGNNGQETFPVWIEDIHFFDLTKPKEQPQFIYCWLRRQDEILPKRNFMTLFYNQFNMDVLCRMVGEPAKIPNGINSINSSLDAAKEVTKTNQSTVSGYQYQFDKEPVNQFPSGWQGMKNISVKQFENNNWLALNTDGYWYPKQYNKEIKDNFSLSFNLRWNKDIAYNSGSFTVSFCSLSYDNTAEVYKTEGNANIMSLYDGYTGNFNRVMCWFDPYANNGGNLTIYSYAANESIVTNKKITLPEFYLTKNNQQVKLLRKGNALVVFINDRKEAEVENVFIPSVKYNLYSFSRYKGNSSDNKKDVFYLSNINAAY